MLYIVHGEDCMQAQRRIKSINRTTTLYVLTGVMLIPFGPLCTMSPNVLQRPILIFLIMLFCIGANSPGKVNDGHLMSNQKVSSRVPFTNHKNKILPRMQTSTLTYTYPVQNSPFALDDLE